MQDKSFKFIKDRSLEGYFFCLLFGSVGLAVGGFLLPGLVGVIAALLIGFSICVAIGFLIGHSCFSEPKEKSSFDEAYASCLLLIAVTVGLIAIIVGIIWLLTIIF